MKVKAKFPAGKFGFAYDRRVYDGDEFELKDPKHFSSKWMEKLEDDEVKPRRGRKPASEQVADDQGAE